MRRIRFAELGVPPHRPHVAVTRIAPGVASIRHTHDFLETFLVLDGEGIHHWNGCEEPISTGYFAVIRPRDAHWYSAPAAGRLVFINVAVSSRWWKSFCFMAGLAIDPEVRLEGLLEGAMRRALEAELSRCGQENDSQAAFRAWSLAVALGREKASGRPEPPEWLESLRSEIHRPDADLTREMGFWQRRSGRSAEHLARSCRKFYGVTPSGLLNQARVEQAKRRLRAGSAKVIEIAFDCGFGNMANFHRVFLRLAGKSPGAWRREASLTVPVAGKT